MYSKLTSNITGLLGATLGLPGAELRPFGKASYSSKEIQNQRKPDVRKSYIRNSDEDSVASWQTHAKEKDNNAFFKQGRRYYKCKEKSNLQTRGRWKRWHWMIDTKHIKGMMLYK